ncbi:BnaC03g67430D [Brassica napus]|uniref:START domain-containing protein n=2 Tax=Brassica TaxID=3705 RepID=A0A3P6BE25_BRAOL|nr:unnamed protein product [Brassica napus]CDY39874.1 BnaC03g67430D [Brassica napus]VDD00516.1 unnamed protein product [Brassica oleracea]
MIHIAPLCYVYGDLRLARLFMAEIESHGRFYSSDRCTSKYSWWRLFIVAGAAAIAVSVLVIGHAADIGWACRDGEGKGMIKPEGDCGVGFVVLVLLLLGFLQNRWAEMFECIVAAASTVEVISNGSGGSRNGSLQLMQAEFQVMSPLFPIRQVKFLRYCKQHGDGLWAVVDISYDVNREKASLRMHHTRHRQ